MSKYIRNRIDDVISVRSIVTVLRLDLRNMSVFGESHDFPEIFYVKQEQSYTAINGKPILLEAGSLVIFGPNSFHGEPFKYIPGGIVEIISFDADSHILEQLYDRPIKLNSRQREQFDMLISRGLAMFQKVENDPRGKGTSVSETADIRDLQRLKNLLEVFLLELSQTQEDRKVLPVNANQAQFYRQQMDRLTEFLVENLENNLTLKQIETAMGFSESTLRRLVHRFRDCGPISYYQELKIREAKRLIENSSLNMTEISVRLGFSSLHYFSRVFRDKTGLSPSDYAKDCTARTAARME